MAVVLAFSGCGTPPTASISHPTEYTALHLQAAQSRIGAETDVAGVPTNLHRYFATPEASYPSNRLRMDVMLDEAQVATARRQSLTLDFLLKAIATPGTIADAPAGGTDQPEPPLADASGAAEPKPNTDGKSNDKDQAGNSGVPSRTWDSTTQNALAQVMEASVTDSPFDRLDRVSDFYAAYMLKHLRLQGDSRSLDTRLLAHWYTNALPDHVRTNLAALVAHLESTPPTHRLLLLGLQTQVTAGSKANYMTGVRVRLRDQNDQPVQVLRLHPSRTYDLDLTAVQDESTLAWKIEGAGKPHASVTLEGQMGGKSKQETMKRFYARLGKVSGYVDAGAGEFGWDFYPSNLRLVHANVVKSFFGLFLGTVERLRTKGFLEAGGRDAFALVLVPWDAKEITYQVHTSAGPFSPDGAGLLWRRRHPQFDTGWSEPRKMQLSPASPWEAVAATVPLVHWSAPISPAKAIGNQMTATHGGRVPGVTPAGVDGIASDDR